MTGPTHAPPPPGTPAETDTGTPPPAVRVTLTRTFLAMMAREIRVIRKNFWSTFLRVIMQPVLMVFVFAYVLPSTGAATFGGVAGAGNFSTILVPGLVGSSIIMQGVMAVVFPLMMELSWQKSITDRALAPLSIPLLAVQKICAAGLQALLAGLLVFPAVLFIHTDGQRAEINVANWPLLVAVLLLGALLSAAGGLLLGTLMDPQKVQIMFTIILMPMMMLGCVYYPWQSLDGMAWLKWASLINPMVYVNEGLRAALTPDVGHMPIWAFGTVIIVATAVLVWAATRSFTRRVLT